MKILDLVRYETQAAMRVRSPLDAAVSFGKVTEHRC
jgi:hypothetical protein